MFKCRFPMQFNVRKAFWWDTHLLRPTTQSSVHYGALDKRCFANATKVGRAYCCLSPVSTPLPRFRSPLGSTFRLRDPLLYACERRRVVWCDLHFVASTLAFPHPPRRQLHPCWNLALLTNPPRSAGDGIQTHPEWEALPHPGGPWRRGLDPTCMDPEPTNPKTVHHPTRNSDIALVNPRR